MSALLLFVAVFLVWSRSSLLRLMDQTPNGLNVLVDKLKNEGRIQSPEIERVFRRVDRANYCSKNPYLDSPQKIDMHVTISAPHIVRNI